MPRKKKATEAELLALEEEALESVEEETVVPADLDEPTSVLEFLDGETLKKEFPLPNDYKVMCAKSGIYTDLWVPQLLAIGRAGALSSSLRTGRARLANNKHYYQEDGSEGHRVNDLIDFLDKIIAYCESHPTLFVSVS